MVAVCLIERFPYTVTTLFSLRKTTQSPQPDLAIVVKNRPVYQHFGYGLTKIGD